LGGRKDIQPVKTCSTNPERLSSGTDRGEGPRVELADPGSSGKMAIKQN